MQSLAALVGSWGGTCGFRMMPTDPFHEAPATAEVTTAVGGSLVALAYTWSHPEEGARDGLLVVGQGPEGGDATALWGDSFHQHPTPAAPAGWLEDGVLTLEYDYGADWRWIIVVDASVPDVLSIRMDNVVPAHVFDDPAEAGAYPVMVGELRRAGGR